jgi:hypothetical protein
MKCAEPNAPTFDCKICKGKVFTCQEVDGSWCKAHPDGVELITGDWVCSVECWEIAADQIKIVSENVGPYKALDKCKSYSWSYHDPC